MKETAPFLGAGRAAGGRHTGARRALRMAPWKWNWRRRLMACVALAAAAFVLATFGWRLLGADSRDRSTSEREALERRIRESRAKLARLPRLRQTVGAQRGLARAPAAPAGGDWQALADLANRTGVRLIALEPAPRTPAHRGRPGEAAGRALRIDARSAFPGLYAFVRGLSTLPVLVAPGAIDVKRDANELVWAATLNVFDAIPAQRTAAGERPTAPDVGGGQSGRTLSDPFHVDTGLALPGTAAVRLVGLVHDGRRALALIEVASGTHATVAAPGQTLGAEKVAHVDALGVTLSSGTGARRLALPEDGR